MVLLDLAGVQGVERRGVRADYLRICAEFYLGGMYGRIRQCIAGLRLDGPGWVAADSL